MVHIGIDLQKGSSHFYAENEGGEKVGSGEVLSDEEGFSELVRRYLERGEVRVALETGNLAFLLGRAMERAGAWVHIVNPYQNALIAQSTKKTDRLDAKQLCRQLRLGQLPPDPVYLPSVEAEELRRLIAARARLIKERGGLSSRAIRLAERHGYGIRKSGLTCWRNWERLQVASVQWAEGIDRELLGQYLEDAWRLERQIRELTAAIERRVAKDFAGPYALLCSVPGVGLLTAAALIAQVERIERFGSARQLCRYLGLTAVVKQSGKREYSGGISKQGNGRLRGYLTQAALQCLRHGGEDDSLGHWYLRIKRRRGWRKARVALARKLAALCYGVWRRQRAYDPAYLKLPLELTQAA